MHFSKDLEMGASRDTVEDLVECEEDSFLGELLLMGISKEDAQQVQQIMTTKYEYVNDPTFSKPNAERIIIDEAPEMPVGDTSWLKYNLRTDKEKRQNEGSLLNVEQEQAIFLQFNFYRSKVSKVREQVEANGMTEERARTMLELHAKAKECEDLIAHCNLGLVIAMIKKTSNGLEFDELFSEGNVALLKAIRKFDVSRGFKFSTYACRAILKAFSTAGKKRGLIRAREGIEYKPVHEPAHQHDLQREREHADSAAIVKSIVASNRANLTDVEKMVIRHRYGFDEIGNPQTNMKILSLKEIGKMLEVTAERVRQIQNEAVRKIGEALHRIELNPTAHNRVGGDQTNVHIDRINSNAVQVRMPDTSLKKNDIRIANTAATSNERGGRWQRLVDDKMMKEVARNATWVFGEQTAKVVSMVFTEGKTYKEVANALGKSPKVIAATISNARKKVASMKDHVLAPKKVGGDQPNAMIDQMSEGAVIFDPKAFEPKEKKGAKQRTMVSDADMLRMFDAGRVQFNPRTSEILNLHLREKRPIEDIATETGLSAVRVRTIISKSREKTLITMRSLRAKGIIK